MIRSGYSVGRTTQESSFTDQLRRFKPRNLQENTTIVPKYINPSKESLIQKCINILVENYEERPIKSEVLKFVPATLIGDVTKNLPLTLNSLIGARYVYNENYWKKCCVEKYGWHNCDISEHGYMWKQLYFEKLLNERLEDFDPETEKIEDFYEFADAAMDYIFTITFKQLPSHLDIFELCSLLPNINKIDITYGITKIGMQYERMLFGMKISDATCLAKVFDSTDTLTTVIMTSNLIDDDLLRMLMTGLIKNNTITHLDLSHNKITNHGARLLSKLLGENSVLTVLDISDNNIHSEGGRYLARGLRENDALLGINLRLNRLGDNGCRMLLEGIQDNVTLQDLNLASNDLSHQSVQILSTIVRNPEHSLHSLDISSNSLNEDNLELLRISLKVNKTLCSIDIRNNPGYGDGNNNIVKEIEEGVYNTEIKVRRIQGHM